MEGTSGYPAGPIQGTSGYPAGPIWRYGGYVWVLHGSFDVYILANLSCVGIIHKVHVVLVL